MKKLRQRKLRKTTEVKQEGINKDGETETEAGEERDRSNSNSTMLGVLAEIYK